MNLGTIVGICSSQRAVDIIPCDMLYDMVRHNTEGEGVPAT